MNVRDLMRHWEQQTGAGSIVREFSVQLTLYDMARVLALADMYPAKNKEQIIAELLGAALDELQEAFPYTQGNRIIANDEYDDPIYEDVGPTPVFVRKTDEYLRQLESELKSSPDAASERVRGHSPSHVDGGNQ